MSIIWAEGFDHYGTSPNGGRDAMLAGAWAQVAGNASGGNNNIITDAIPPRSGEYSFRIQQNAFATGNINVRRVLGAARLMIGMAFGINFQSLPSENNIAGMEFRDNANDNIIRITFQSDGSLGVFKGSDATLVAASDPILTAGAWMHIEAKLIIDPIVGELEIRVNGVAVIHLTNQDFGEQHTTQVKWGTVAGSTAVTYYLDDIIAWDDQGLGNNDFLGPQRVYTLFPAEDRMPQDFTPVGAATGYEAIDEKTPDYDTTYIIAPDEGMESRFGITGLPPEVEIISGLYIPFLGRLEEAGAGAITVSVISDEEEAVGPQHMLTPTYSYFGSGFPVDPATGEPWTREAVEAMSLVIKKTL